MRRSMLVGLGLSACVSTGDVLGDGHPPQLADLADEAWVEWPGNAPDRLLAPGDLDGDGRADLVAWAAGSSSLTLLGAGSRVLELSSAVVPSIADDIDGDGRADLAITLPSECQVLVLHGGDPAPTLAITTPCGLATGSGIGDLDGDGAAELAVAPTADGTLVYFGRASRTPRTPADADASLTADLLDRDVGLRVVPIGDASGDARADVAVTARGATLVYRGERFLGPVPVDRVAERLDDDAVVDHAPVGLGDLDGDGHDELALRSFDALYTIFYGGGAGYGAPAAALRGTGFRPEQATIVGGDLDGDGARDLVVGDPSLHVDGAPVAGGVHLLRGTEARLAGTIELGAAAATWLGAATAVALADLDDDGLDDLAVAVPSARAVYVIRGRAR